MWILRRRSRGPSLLTLTLALVLLFAACAGELRQAQTDPVAVPAADGESMEEVAGVADAVDATLSAALSGCGLCQQTGYCDRAFRNSPGQFCLALSSGAPCCCPLNAQCAASPFDCRCRRSSASAYPSSYAPYADHSSSSGSSFGTVLLVLLLLCCICCCWLPARKRHMEREETVHYAQAVQTSYGTGQSQYGYPGYQPSAPAYENPTVVVDSHPYGHGGGGGGGGGGSSLAAGAVGALGGLGVGAALGSMWGRDHDNRGDNSSSYFAGDSGGFGDVAQDSYTFSGDTGGDSGGDFGGDS